MSPPSLVISETVYPYLVAQRGAIDDMKDDPAIWCGRYADMLASEFACFEPYLPEQCDAILDIGGGMGGINVLLNHHYGGDCSVTLLDGTHDEPRMVRHSQTFSNFDVARDFLHLNGVRDVRSIDAGHVHPTAPSFFDLVISLKSWCFHYPPETYLDLVIGCVIRGQTQLIVDVRRDRPEWAHLLERTFAQARVIYHGPKFSTFWFRA
jgi:hypothetical protein